MGRLIRLVKGKYDKKVGVGQAHSKIILIGGACGRLRLSCHFYATFGGGGDL